MKYKLTDLDPDQCTRYSYDHDAQANRVVVANDFGLASALKNIKIEAVSNIQIIEVPTIITETKVVEIEKPIIVDRIRIETIEKPVIVEKLEIREIERPVIIREYELIKIEVPVIQKEQQIIQVEKSLDIKFKIIELILMAAIVAALIVRK